MHLNQSYTDYLQRNVVSTRLFPAACLEIFLLDQAQDRHHRREVEKLREFAEIFDWKLVRDYEKVLSEGYTIVVSDLAKSILWTNHRFLAMTGYQPREAIGRTPHFLQGPETDPVRLRQLSKDLVAAQHDRSTGPIRNRLINYRKNGTSYLCDIEIDPIRTKKGELTHFIAVEKEV
ncbi:PAS domain-containing protein [Larkinella terrae]|uniref:PAS domain-containing protein n=1 Tax=Larkinella terrae TaxID=2025311 RepID=A0A7K0EQN8_9BACT|nr:PAS domain-containing protein [Larkinella terrae]MRS64124.1 PAS domain-containing protein [Larkinella terrae]